MTYPPNLDPSNREAYDELHRGLAELRRLIEAPGDDDVNLRRFQAALVGQLGSLLEAGEIQAASAVFEAFGLAQSAVCRPGD